MLTNFLMKNQFLFDVFLRLNVSFAIWSLDRINWGFNLIDLTTIADFGCDMYKQCWAFAIKMIWKIVFYFVWVSLRFSCEILIVIPTYSFYFRIWFEIEISTFRKAKISFNQAKQIVIAREFVWCNWFGRFLKPQFWIFPVNFRQLLMISNLCSK